MSGAAKGGPWKAQPWPLGCMYAIMLKDPADSATKQKVKSLLDSLATDPSNGIEAVMDPTQVAAAGGPADAAYVVTLRKGLHAYRSDNRRSSHPNPRTSRHAWLRPKNHSGNALILFRIRDGHSKRPRPRHHRHASNRPSYFKAAWHKKHSANAGSAVA